ncbi:ribosomal protein S18 [Xylaria palmicola]|nr:ribosomal protein S18 [Xylaria palmicola]
MPPRIPILSALRQGMPLVKTPSAPISTTAAPKALRDLRNSTSSILNLESGAKEGARNSTDMLGEIYKNIRGPRRGSRPSRQNIEDLMKGRNRHDDYLRQMSRRWRAGDVYAPHDMSPSEVAKSRKNTSHGQDVVDMLGLRPLDMYRNFSVISEFMTDHGRIKRAADTGLKPANQRKMAKAIRRAIGLGLHPSVHRHPELIMRGPNRVVMEDPTRRVKGLM